MVTTLCRRYVKRQWQLLENQVKYDAEQKEKAQKEVASQSEEARRSRVDNTDSDEDLGKAEPSGLLVVLYLVLHCNLFTMVRIG